MRGANVSEGNYTLRWANAIPSETAAYRLVFLSYATGGYVAQSPIFNLTLPPGEARNMSAGDAPASPGTSNTEQKSSSTGLSGGELAAAIVVPILAFIVILAGALYLWRRKRKQHTVPSQDDESPESHIDRESGKPELDANGRVISDSKHRSVELAGEKDFIKWELPSTPPRKSIDPVEMPAEVPLAEMSAGAARHELGASENGSTIAGSTSVEDKISPLMNQDNFAKDDVQGQRSPVSLKIPDAHEEGAASTTGRSRFQEALYDIISDELRRPDDAATASGYTR